MPSEVFAVVLLTKMTVRAAGGGEGSIPSDAQRNGAGGPEAETIQSSRAP